jgi:hypothetical protein
LHGRFFEGGEAMEAMAVQDAGDGGFGDAKDGEDLGVGTALPSQSQNASDQLGVGLAVQASRDTWAVEEAGGEAGLDGALEPAAQGPIGDVKGGGDERRERFWEVN